jgi:hypothetical protein
MDGFSDEFEDLAMSRAPVFVEFPVPDDPDPQ